MFPTANTLAGARPTDIVEAFVWTLMPEAPEMDDVAGADIRSEPFDMPALTPPRAFTIIEDWAIVPLDDETVLPVAK